jgi:hypothetical protein
VATAVQGWDEQAKALGVSARTRKLIAKNLEQVRQDNASLMR